MLHNETGRSPLQVRLLGFLLVGNAALFSLYSGVGVLLALQVEALDPAGKVANLGLIAGISAIFATVFNPIGGALSDRTHTRFGRRNPWLIGGALAALGSMALLSGAGSVLMLGIGWCVGQAMTNFYLAALTAMVPDRVPTDRRGAASAVAAVSISVGAIAGTQIAARFAGNLQGGYLVFGVIVVVAAVLVVSFTRDPRPGEYVVAAKAPFLPAFLSALRHRDFLWVFLGRAMIILGYFMVLAYLLYIVKDYIGLPPGLAAADAVARVTLLSTGCAIVAALVGGPLSDRLDRRKAFVVVAGVVSALSLMIPILVPSWTGVLIYAAIHGTAFGIYGAVDIALATLVLPSQGDVARDMGVLNVAAAGPQIAAPFVASLVITIGGGYPPLFVAATAVSLIGALAVLPIKSIR